MSDAVNPATSSKKTKRPYRKGNPTPSKERQQAYLSRKSETHKALSAVIRIPLKKKLEQFAAEEGITQAEMIERLIESEIIRRSENL
ncbi:replication regulatory protein RepA [Salmonella enterica]|uniref:Protein CopB n=6 Tax=Salmonella enterica TaxID=28901 RepID=A0A600YZA5_SALNE|nr:replication regulatory protein RepA [Salmonella enterica]EAA8376543.1 replication regulatory protein RepA [Salmonella enterica subsp. enterica serovar Bareilly]EAU2215240.1 replication regulatory protein RepA [Salmonella enterica subsp. enterica serovar Rubislaw]EBD0186607.1 replication regulatory protein RepA [Salmonella enterica subsp. enterica serovar Schwarzengrund]EBH8880034.1 replication regulatory protein RepA [Salmonella enterica subsp. houtenae serovar 53:z4,z23:-]EBV5845383.1 repl